MHCRQLRVVCAIITSCIHPYHTRPTLHVHTGQGRRRIAVLPKRGVSGTHGNASASRLTAEAVHQAEVQVHYSEVRGYVHPHKRPCIALQPSVYICSMYIAVVTPLIAHHPIDSLRVYHTVIVISRGGDKRLTDRTYAYIMHCFAWGTSTPCIPVYQPIAQITHAARVPHMHTWGV